MKTKEATEFTGRAGVKETTITKIAEFTDKARFEDLPFEVVEESKRLILDSVACALAGATSDKGKAGLAFSRYFGGHPEATIIGLGDKVSVLGAAFANGELINALDWDAVLVPGHITPFVLPAYLAVGESIRISGELLILANAIAHEISHRLGKTIRNQRDIRDGKVLCPTVMGYSCSVLGGAAGVGKVKGFDSDLLASALGMAGHIAPAQAQTPWAKNGPPTTAKYLLAGWAAQASLTAALLAELGHRGDIQILDGEFGFSKYMGSEKKWEPDLVTNDLGKIWLFPPQQVYKPYPHCRILHGSLDCLIRIIEENDVEPEEIESIKAWLESLCVEPVWSNRIVECQMDAQFSIAHGLSVAAHRIPPGPEWQNYETIMNPSIQAMMKKVTFEPHPGYVKALEEDNRSRLAKVEVKARGKIFTEERRYPKGSPSPLPDTFMTNDELVAKFKIAAQRILPLHKMDAAINAILELEKMEDISELMRLICIAP